VVVIGGTAMQQFHDFESILLIVLAVVMAVQACASHSTW